MSVRNPLESYWSTGGAVALLLANNLNWIPKMKPYIDVFWSSKDRRCLFLRSHQSIGIKYKIGVKLGASYAH